MSRPMEELRGYFAVHSQGLGHATRAVALARGLLERRRDLYLLFLAGSPALDLVVANGFDALTMPPAPGCAKAPRTSGPLALRERPSSSSPRSPRRIGRTSVASGPSSGGSVRRARNSERILCSGRRRSSSPSEAPRSVNS